MNSELYKKLKRVIIESPCSATPDSTVDEHKEYLRRALLDSILNHDEAPIASHGLLAFPGILDDTIPFQRTQGMAVGWAWIEAAEKIVVYGDYGISPGMNTALDIARLYGIPVSYRLIGRNDNPSEG